MDKIRIISDLHLDLNKRYPLKLEKDVFTVIAGDTSGDPKHGSNWIQRHVKNGVFVSGNHLVYNKNGLTIQELREIYANNFPESKSMTYLEKMTEKGVFYKKVDGILFVGSTLYTDFCLNGRYEDNVYWSRRRMNDYHWGLVKDDRLGTIIKLNPEYLAECFKKTLAAFTEVIERFQKEEPDTPVVVVTHYCPSKKCISEAYLDSEMNASYVSDLEDFITSHPNIRLWACGHVHHQDSFKVGNCLIVMNPRGYVDRCEDAQFDPELYVDTKNWELHKHERTPEQKTEWDKRFKQLIKAGAWLI